MSYPFLYVLEFIKEWMKQSGVRPSVASFLTAAGGVVAVLVLALLVDRFLRWAIHELTPKVIERFGLLKKTEWVVALQQRLVAQRSAHIVATLLVYYLIPYALNDYPHARVMVQNLIEGYVIMVVTLALTSIVRASGDVLVDRALPTGVSLQFIAQAVQIVIWVIGTILAAAAVFDTSVTVLLSGIAGMTAVVLLIFRDSILGFVAGLQLAGNDMLRIDDWIEVPKYGADGTVTNIGLTTVKVQNFDKTITTVPTYALVSESFRNWRGMTNAGCRRIKRSVAIDMDHIAFLNDQGIEKLRSNPRLESAGKEFAALLDSDEANQKDPVTNVIALRAYIKAYLTSHPDLRHDMTTMVRQLPPGAEGLPIEIYAFASTTDWKQYEQIQAAIIEHVIAILPEFGLQAFQGPTSADYLKR